MIPESLPDAHNSTSLCPSVGSSGHPFSCSLPCKYQNKATGCKDGCMCTQCHLCVWQPQNERVAPQKVMQWAPASAGGIVADEALSAGNLTPDPRNVWKQVLDSSSDGPPSCAKTPPMVMDGRAIPSLEIARELQNKLQRVQFQQKRQNGPHDEDNEVASILFNDSSLPQRALPQPWDQKVLLPPPPPPFNASGSSSDALDSLVLTIPPPPGLPHPASKETRAGEAALTVGTHGGSKESSEIIRSIGSVGHPTSCGAPCRYVKRKGGCRNGQACRECHLCQWHRERANKADKAPVSIPLSIGTKGHPHSCGPPCRYVKRKTGCRDGADCRNCHQCWWQRETKEAAMDAQGADAMPMYAGTVPPSGRGAPLLQMRGLVQNINESSIPREAHTPSTAISASGSGSEDQGWQSRNFPGHFRPACTMVPVSALVRPPPGLLPECYQASL